MANYFLALHSYKSFPGIWRIGIGLPSDLVATIPSLSYELQVRAEKLSLVSGGNGTTIKEISPGQWQAKGIVSTSYSPSFMADGLEGFTLAADTIFDVSHTVSGELGETYLARDIRSYSLEMITVELKTGWNKITLMRQPINPDVRAVFPTAEVVYFWHEDRKYHEEITTVVEVGKTYDVAVMSDTTYTIAVEPLPVKPASRLEEWWPCSPAVGPPLPKWLGVIWPWYKEMSA